eukprot:g70548.t1
MQKYLDNPLWLLQRAILTPLNKDVDYLNDIIMHTLEEHIEALQGMPIMLLRNLDKLKGTLQRLVNKLAQLYCCQE